MISQTFSFEYTATCNDGFYVCNVKTIRSNGDVVETALAIADSPILEGCESMYYICIIVLCESRGGPATNGDHCDLYKISQYVLIHEFMFKLPTP